MTEDALRHRFSKRAKVVKLVAKVKRLQYNQTEVREELLHYLHSFKYLFFRRELIKETIYLEPGFYLEYFEKNMTLLNDKENMIWYLSLKDYYNQNELTIPEDWREYIAKHAPFLYSNTIEPSQNSKLNIFNEHLDCHQIAPIALYDVQQGVSVGNVHVSDDWLTTNVVKRSQCDERTVSILVTVYNSSAILKTSISSLLNQTWQDLEVIVVNDASTDDSLEVIKQIASQDNRVKIIDLPINVGTFSAKNIGAKYATGDFLTCHDSDDWAHPQKIEAQITPLLFDNELMATTSQWVRVDELGRYHVRQVYPYIQQNPASVLFHREKVMNDAGLWHNVRTGADSEFLERLKLVYGSKSVKLIKGVLTLGSYRVDSLTTSKVYGAYTKQAALKRIDYWESWRLWHLEQMYSKEKIYMPLVDELLDMEQPMIAIPNDLAIDVNEILFNLNNLKTDNIVSPK